MNRIFMQISPLLDGIKSEQKLPNGIYTREDGTEKTHLQKSEDNCRMVMFIAFLCQSEMCRVRYERKLCEPFSAALPEHLNSWSCKSATFCPFNWPGEWHRVYGANRGALRRNFESHDRWQSHANGLSDKRNARRRGMLENISRGIVVMLLLFSVKISNSWRFLTAISSMQAIWLWSNWRLRSAGTPLNIRFDIAAISLFDKSLKEEKKARRRWNKRNEVS